LGCTHYPILKSYIESIIPENIKVIAQGPIIAEKLEDYLIRHSELEAKCSKNNKVHFLTTENAEDFDKKASLFLGTEIKSQHIKL
jgi:glutamate racemase